MPKRPDNGHRLYTLALLYLKRAALQAGWECDIVDASFGDLSRKEAAARIAEHGRPRLLGFCLHTPRMCQEALGIAAELERLLGRPTPLLVGGHFASRKSTELLERFDRIGYVVEGEGEESLRLLLSALRSRRGLSAVPGLKWRCPGGALGSGPPRCLAADLDTLGDIDYGWADGDFGPDEWSLVTSRGCSGRCSFCLVGPLWGEPGCWRGHSPEWVAAHLETLVRRHGAVRVRIVDDNFLGGPDPLERAGRIAAALRERRLRVPFSIMTRADTVCGFPKAFRTLKGVGLDHVFLGLESSDEDTLRRFGKGVSPKEGRTAVGILDRLGITVTCGTILFHPWMSRESLLSDIGYLRGLMDEFAGVCFLGLNELDIFEGTPLSAGYRSGGLEWRCDWRAERPRMQEVYDRWRRIQAGILFPAMRVAPPGRDVALRRIYAYWQLDALQAMLRRGTGKGAADHVGDAYASMCRLLNAHAGTTALGGFLGRGSAQVGGREETGSQERCFL